MCRSTAAGGARCNRTPEARVLRNAVDRARRAARSAGSRGGASSPVFGGFRQDGAGRWLPVTDEALALVEAAENARCEVPTLAPVREVHRWTLAELHAAVKARQEALRHNASLGPQANPAPAGSIPNRYAGRCTRCGQTVDEYEGRAYRGAGGRWATQHDTCPTARGSGGEEIDVPDLPTVEAIDVPGTRSEDLFAHQAELVGRIALGERAVYLADEQGLGKTASATIAAVAADAQRVVVIAPAVTKIGWQREIESWVPGAEVQVLSARKAAPIDPEARFVVVNYEIAGAWEDELKAWGADALVVDEAHYVKDSRAARSKAVANISENLCGGKGALRIMMSGTPIPNRPIELAHPLTVLGKLNAMGGFWAYAKRYAEARQDRYGWDMTGAAHLDELHDKLVANGMFRRRKSDVLDLPSRTVADVPVALEKDGARTVKTAQDALIGSLRAAVEEAHPDTTPTKADVRAAVGQALSSNGSPAFTQLAALRQATGLAKVLLVTERVQSLVEQGEPVVVMVHHRSVQDELMTALAEHGPVQITGGQDAAARQASIDAFQTGNAKVAVCSIQAAGVGITLNRASQVVLGELPWTAAAQDQAIDRVHRIGQDAPVTAWRVLAADTLDEQLAATISRKAAISLAAVDGDAVDANANEISAADVLTDALWAVLRASTKAKGKRAA